MQEHQHPSLPDAEGARAAGRGTASGLGAARAGPTSRRARFLSLGRGYGGARCAARPPVNGHATAAALAAEGGIRALRISHVAYPDLAFHTPSGKVEFVSEQAAKSRPSGLAGVSSPRLSRPTRLALRTGRTLAHFHGFYDQRPRAADARRRRSRAATVDLARGRRGACAQGRRRDSASSTSAARCRRERSSRIASRPAPSGSMTGWTGLNTLTSGVPLLPDAAVDLFTFSGGQARIRGPRRRCADAHLTLRGRRRDSAAATRACVPGERRSLRVVDRLAILVHERVVAPGNGRSRTSFPRPSAPSRTRSTFSGVTELVLAREVSLQRDPHVLAGHHVGGRQAIEGDRGVELANPRRRRSRPPRRPCRIPINPTLDALFFKWTPRRAPHPRPRLEIQGRHRGAGGGLVVIRDHLAAVRDRARAP